MVIIFWQPILSLHQADLMKGLANSGEVEVIVIADRAHSAERSQMGWPTELDYGAARVVVLEGNDSVLGELPLGDPGAVHVISGFGGDRVSSLGIRYATRAGAQFGFYLEPWNVVRPLKGLAVFARYRFTAFRLSRHRPFFLSTSVQGERQLRRLGVPARSIYPYGYFMDVQAAPTGSLPKRAAGHSRVSALFVGSLSERKNVLELAKQLKPFCGDVNFRFIGDGPLRAGVEETISGCSGYEVLPSLANKQVLTLIREADFLVLPSIHDGWGAVVSEALLCGTRVLVSDASGSAQVVSSRAQGRVVRPDGASIRDGLRDMLKCGPQESTHRAQLASWARRALSAEAGATYLRRILEFHISGGLDRPKPPWSGVGSEG